MNGKSFFKLASLLMAMGSSVVFAATEIGTAAEFVSAMTDDPAGDYALTADIDLTDAGYTSAASFSGTLDGRGHVITGLGAQPLFTLLTGTIEDLTIDGRVNGVNTSVTLSAGFAVFATTAQGATVRRCRVAGYSINGTLKGSSIGGMFRTVKDGTLVVGCVSDSSLRLRQHVNLHVGGLAASVACTSGYTGPWAARFVACTNLSDIAMTTRNYNAYAVGGIVGIVSIAQVGFPRAEFEDCINQSAMIGLENGMVGGIVGGIAGTGSSSTSTSRTKGADVAFVGCRNEGAISGSGASSLIGGIVGDICTGSTRTTFTNCVNIAAITIGDTTVATDTAGGLVGRCGYPNHSNNRMLQFVNCANYGNVTANKAGGIIGLMETNGGWSQGNFRFYNCANYGVVSNLSENMSGGIFGYYTGSTASYLPLVIDNCWSLCSPIYGSSSAKAPTSTVANFASVDEDYANATAIASLNAAVTAENGYATWVQGRYYPEFESIASSPTAGKIDVIFRDWDGTPLKTEAVESGASATPPTAPSSPIEGLKFKNWGKSLDNLTEITLFTARYGLPDGLMLIVR